MTGLRRLLFAALAALCRGLAWLPLNLGKALAWLAERCEERAR